MITFGTLGLSLSAEVARAVLAFASEDETRVSLSCLGIDEGDVCATDGHAAVRFTRAAVDEGAPAPPSWNRRLFRRAKVAAALKAAGRQGPVVLLWSELEPEGGYSFAQLSKAEPASDVRDDDLPIAWDPSLLARLEVAAKACRREREQGEVGAPPLPPALLVSLGGYLDPCRYEIGEACGRTAHTAFVTIMPMNARARGESQSDRAAREAREKTARQEMQAAERAKTKAARAPGVLPPVSAEVAEDERAREELGRCSSEKLAAVWLGRPAQKQVLSNILRGRKVSKDQRSRIEQRMRGWPLWDLRFAVAEVLGSGAAKAEVAA